MNYLSTRPERTVQRCSLKRFLTAGTLTLGLSSILMGASALASRLPNNRVVFDRSPELVEAEVLPASQVQDGQFQIVINVPENAGEALEALVVQPQETGIYFPFDPAAT